MALTIPTLTWTLEPEVALDPIDNAAEFLARLKERIEGTTAGWRIEDHDVGSGDTYLWIGAPAGSPNADDRIYIFLGTPNAAQLDTYTIGAASRVYVGYCPGHGGGAPDQPDATSATPVSATRWTKLFAIVPTTSMSRFRLIASEEVLVLSIEDNVLDRRLAVMGPFVAAYDDAAGEAGDNGRVYGIFTTGPNTYAGSGTSVLTEFWSEDVGFAMYAVVSGGQHVFRVFDPSTPAQLYNATKAWVQQLVNLKTDHWQTQKRADGDYLVRSDVRVMGAGSGTPNTYRLFGALRQIRPASSRVGDTVIGSIEDGTPLSVVLSTRRSPPAAGGTVEAIAFDNY